ncbi:MAG: thiolase domain-containing protein [Candidatus Aenigmarchaeota archaeon]|nr:thiolase domain-containing protein [Candidatus Aenigmarchaeota archaeon]
MTNVAVVGVGQTKFGELWEHSLRDLGVKAAAAALGDAKAEAGIVQSLYIGNMSAGRFLGQEHLGALIADNLGIPHIPAVRCEAACASGSVALRSAYLDIKSGNADAALVVGVEKMTDLANDEVSMTLAAAGDQEWEAGIGLTFAGLYALMARAHMHKFGTTREQLAMVSVQNHSNGKNNPYAQFNMAVTLEDVLNSSVVADPLRLLDCSPITDGAAAALLVSDKLAKQFENPVWILASEQANDAVALHDRKSIVEMQAAKMAAKKAYEKTGLSAKHMDVAEVHDCFSINEIISLEALGFCEPGRGGKFVESGAAALDGEIPVNTTGGLKSIGHPVGATGVRQICDIVRQLRGDSINQIKGAKTGMNLNVGGSGATAVVNILGNELKGA